MTPAPLLNSLNLPLKSGKLIDQAKLQLGPNMADPKILPLAKLQEIYLYMMNHYIMPQIMGRRSYEVIWDVLYDAYRMRLKISDLKLTTDDSKFLQKLIERAQNLGGQDVNITDSLIFDTVDRMANLTHFMMWKDGMPAQYNPLRAKATPGEDRFYSPTQEKYQAGNCLLEWFTGKSGVYRKSRTGSHDHYLYGISFVISNLVYQLEQRGQEVTLKNLDITYEPHSIRKVWINFMLPLSEMRLQPCPFWYRHSSNFAILQNQYDPVMNPFGYVNLDLLDERNYTAFAGQGEESFMNALKARMASAGQTLNISQAEWRNVAAHWTFMPMLPLDPQTGEFIKRVDGTPVPFRRFVWEQFGTDIVEGKVTPIRLQDASYYGEDLPIYGSTHLEDLDSAAYGMSICETLLNYQIELSTCRSQYVENKNQINNPPAWFTSGSMVGGDPDRINKPGQVIEVTGPNDFGWKQVPDATGTTVQMCEHLRDRAQTTSKAVDAIMGKALGGRTSATEAQNVFQAAMSGVTTDINLYNYDTIGQYAIRVWRWGTKWLDMDILKEITGSYGLELTEDDLALNLSLKYDVGSSFIESIVKQQHIRYFLETGMRLPGIVDPGELLLQLADEVKISGLRKAIIPNGMEEAIQEACEEAYDTYLDKPVMIDPNMNHKIAIEVKTRFLKDKDSAWNEKYGPLPYLNTGVSRAQAIAQQIQVHQNFLIIQQQQQMLAEVANLQMQQSGGAQQGQSGGMASLPSPSSLSETMPGNPGAAM